MSVSVRDDGAVTMPPWRRRVRRENNDDKHVDIPAESPCRLAPENFEWPVDTVPKVKNEAKKRRSERRDECEHEGQAHETIPCE